MAELEHLLESFTKRENIENESIKHFFYWKDSYKSLISQRITTLLSSFQILCITALIIRLPGIRVTFSKSLWLSCEFSGSRITSLLIRAYLFARMKFCSGLMNILFKLRMKYLKKKKTSEEWQNNLKMCFGLLICVSVSSAAAQKANEICYSF